MFCSTVIPTIGRATLDRAVRSVLDQEFTQGDFEVIVVNDSGQPLPQADWHKSARVMIIHTNRRERCVARNAGAALARGQYLHFLDDDDWIEPGAFVKFWTLAQTTDSGWLYGANRFVGGAEAAYSHLQHEMEGNCFVQAMSGEWIPLQASCIKAEVFFAVGGFHPLITWGQDIDLSRRIARISDYACVPEVVATITRDCASTSNAQARPGLTRWGREQILNESGVFNKMRQSAHTNYYSGRLVRVYFTSAAWNLSHGRAFTAASRTTMALAGLIVARSHIFSGDFWRAILRVHETTTCAGDFAAKPVAADTN